MSFLPAARTDVSAETQATRTVGCPEQLKSTRPIIMAERSERTGNRYNDLLRRSGARNTKFLLLDDSVLCPADGSRPQLKEVVTHGIHWPALAFGVSP